MVAASTGRVEFPRQRVLDPSPRGTARQDPIIIIIIIIASSVFALVSVVVVMGLKLRSRLLRFEHVELSLPPGTDPGTALDSLSRLGPSLREDLRAVGIADLSALRAIGVDEPNRRLVQEGRQTGLHSRLAIQDALGDRPALERRRAVVPSNDLPTIERSTGLPQSKPR